MFVAVPEGDAAQREMPTTADRVWSGLDDAWQESFRQAWEALRTGNIAVGACATLRDGTLVHAARNRINDSHAPVGEVFGSRLAHAEVNVLARVRYGQPRQLVLTSTLEPCIQCSAAIRLGPVAVVRFAGGDPLWTGCHDFSPLSPREAARAALPIEGPRGDEVGLFGTLIARFGPGLGADTAAQLKAAGETDIIDLVQRLEDSGEIPRLAAMEVGEAFEYLWPELRALRDDAVRPRAIDDEAGPDGAPITPARR
jgi:tRNA(Arg) A34 adenosine deaminase TadA